MPQQRHDVGKPRLHYWYSSRMSALFEELMPEAVDELETAQSASEVIDTLASYLQRDPTASLITAAKQLLALGVQLPGTWARHTDPARQSYCDVCVYGEAKYSRGNYRLGQTVCHYIDSALGHLQAMAQYGVDARDSESGQYDLGHALWNVVQAYDQPASRDDRLARVDGWE